MPGLDGVVDRREPQGDGRAVAGVLHPHRGDQLTGQHLLPPVGADVVHLAEEDGRSVRGRRPHLQGDGWRPGDPETGGQGRRLEPGVLPREVQREPRAERGELAADAGQRGQGGRGGAGRVGEGLLPAGQRDGVRAGGEPRVPLARRAAQLDLAVGGVDAPGARDAERRAGGGLLVALEVVVEPGRHPGLGPAGLAHSAVVSAGRPVHGYGRAVRRDRPGHRVGLAEREEGVVLALHDEGGHLDPVADRRRAALLQQLAGFGVGLPGHRDPLVHGAQLRLEAPAAGGRGRTGAGVPAVLGFGGGRGRLKAFRGAGREEDAGPELLEDAVREERVGEVPVRDLRGDRVHPPVVAGGEQRHRAAVGGAGDADARIAVRVEPHLGLPGEPVDEPGDVLDLPLGIVQPDPAAGAAEAAGGPGQDGVPVPGQLLGLRAGVLLAAAEAVPEEDGGTFRPVGDAVAGGGEVGGVDRGAGMSSTRSWRCTAGASPAVALTVIPGPRDDGEGGRAGQQAAAAAPGKSELHVETLVAGPAPPERPQAEVPDLLRAYTTGPEYRTRGTPPRGRPTGGTIRTARPSGGAVRTVRSPAGGVRGQAAGGGRRQAAGWRHDARRGRARVGRRSPGPPPGPARPHCSRSCSPPRPPTRPGW
ncbi:hypothetical protein SSAG_06323 [Streptomyces sp. Mg1]|nr:hypothetical protein SSAG_06323 [Streptomyces sp. Mg1]